MDFLVGPAALGGIIMSVGLGAWSLGRWQGGVSRGEPAFGAIPEGGTPETGVAPAPRLASQPAIPCQEVARAERKVALDAVASLGELHAEVSAYRRTQQVLAGVGASGVDLAQLSSAVRQECRFMGLSGAPTCPAPSAASAGCACDADPMPGPAPLRSEPLAVVQPSADFTRV